MLLICVLTNNVIIKSNDSRWRDKCDNHAFLFLQPQPAEVTLVNVYVDLVVFTRIAGTS